MFFQLLPEALAVDGLLSLTVTVFFYYEGSGVILDWPRALYPQLIFDGIEDLVDGKP